ncbi:hypothetical protein ACFRDV_02965 [Streptomyces fagopyri]|uniref:hypothetical protein n=1 Tax=Streptomyces fagopyri TaxID=2662397 RepID=UPI0036AA56A4
MTDHALRLLRENPRLAGPAAFPFGFDLGRAEHAEAGRLASGGPLEPIAGDDTGGTYFVCGDGSVLYADSEGSAGVIGDSVDEALEVLVGLPGRHDHLGLAPADGEESVLAAVARTEEEIREYRAIDDERTELRAGRGLPERSPDPARRPAARRPAPDGARLPAARRRGGRRPRPPGPAPPSAAVGDGPRAGPRRSGAAAGGRRVGRGARSRCVPPSSTGARVICRCCGTCCVTRPRRP